MITLTKEMMRSFLSPASHKPRVAPNNVDKLYKEQRIKVFIGIFIGYAGYYLVRKNFSLAIPQLVEQGFTKGDLGFALSGVAIAYGLSKFLMGSVSDRSDARKFLTLGLLLSAIITLFMGTTMGLSSIAIMFTLQFFNGWVQGMGWPPCGRVMTHWFSHRERGTKMALWNIAHNVGGGLIGPMFAAGMLWFGTWQAGAFVFPATIAIIIAFISFFLVRDTPQSCGLPPIEEYKNDYPKNYSKESEKELTTKEILFTYVLNNRVLWFVAIANAFVYLVRYGVLDWAPTYLSETKGYSIKEIGWAYFAYEWAAIPGTLVCGYISDKFFKGKRAMTTIIFMLLVTIAVLVYWLNPAGHPIVDSLALIAIGFLIYGPVMLIGVQALDLAPKKAAGTSAGFTGFFGYMIGTSLLANLAMGYLVDAWGWAGGFILLIGACLLSILFMGLSWKKEKEIAQTR